MKSEQRQSPGVRLTIGFMIGFVWAIGLPVGSLGQPRADTLIAAMDEPSSLTLAAGTPHVVSAGPAGERVLRFDERFSGTIDLSERGIDLERYDLLTLQVKADRAAFLRVGLDHFPWQGKQARWYVLDGMRGPFEWRTIWIDLRQPEEGPRKTAPTATRTLHLTGFHKATGRSIQDSARAMLLGEIRAVRKTVDLDWDQRAVSQTQTPDGDLVATYPLTVTNPGDHAVTAEVSLHPIETRYASAELSATRMDLAPGAQTTIRARIRLPAEAAERAQPLYAERFEARARAVGVPHSTVPILRSSDPIHLTVTVPPPDTALQFPLLPPPSTLPEHVVHFDASLARRWATAAPPATLIAAAKQQGLSNSAAHAGDRRFLRALIASAYLYDYTSEPRYLDTAAALLGALPDIWNAFYEAWERQPARLISAGIIVRMDDRPHFTLRLGWRLMGTQRSPYQYSYDANARGGSMSALFYAFDMVAAHLAPALRNRIIRDFIVPAGIQCRNHYIGDGNQQATLNAVALYAGLASGNWPLVSFAYSSEHGLPGILEWTFNDDGAHIRDGYQTYTLRPVFWLAELLRGRGKPVYDVYRDRLAKAARHPAFRDRYFWAFVRQHRMTEVSDVAAPAALTARANGPTTVRLEWTDPATNEVGFHVERSETPDGEFERVATITRYVPRYVARCPAPDTPYYFRVRAYNYHAGSSTPSNAVEVRCASNP